MEQARHPEARHTSDTSQQPVRRPPTKPTNKSFCGSAGKNPHEAGNTEERPSAKVAHSTSRQLIWFRNIYIHIYMCAKTM